MRTIHFFIGIDVSKASLDITVLKDGLFLVHQKIENTKEGIHRWFIETGKGNDIRKSNSIFCLEAMGTYGTVLLKYIQSKKWNAWVESALRIKRSLGIQRGKNDKIDSLRIAQYCFTHQQKFKPWTEPRKEIGHLRNLNTMRSRIISSHNQLTVALSENRSHLTKKYWKEIESYCKASIQSLKTDLKRVDTAIIEFIRDDIELSRLFKIITSVYAVGKIMAIEMLIATNEFKNFDSPKKFACYCGVAPFEHTSGTSLTQRSRTSFMANRKVKTALHMCAIAAVKYDGELRDYFKRKTDEGKSKMSALNAIRNKIIHRIFACVRDNRLYVHEHWVKSKAF